MERKCILVTGCAGFIGSNFCRRFIERFPGYTTVGIDDFSAGRRDAVPPQVSLVEGSITDAHLVGATMAQHRPSTVFHFAALPRVSYSVENPAATTYVNVYGTVVLLEQAAKHGVERLVFSSSSSVYGNASSLPTAEATHQPQPESPYALQKYVGERCCQLFSRTYGLDTACLRYFNVYGPGQHGDSAYSTVVSAWLEGLFFPGSRDLYLEGDGLQSRDFCYVDDVVDANILAMLSPRRFGGAPLNVAGGTAVTLLEVRDAIERTTGRHLQLESRPPRRGDVRHTLASTEAAHDALGFEPKVTFGEGLARTVAWFESRRAE